MSLRLGRHDPRCLGERVSDYVAGVLDPAEHRGWDRHLVACALCRQDVAEERRLRESLRDREPAVPSSLRSMLLAVAAPPDEQAPTFRPGSQGGAAGPRRAPPPAARSFPALPVLSPGAPAYHRSALRAALLAAAAAGASAAAAWSLTLAGTSASAPAVTVTPGGAVATPVATDGDPGARTAARPPGTARLSVGPGTSVLDPAVPRLLRPADVDFRSRGAESPP